MLVIDLFEVIERIVHFILSSYCMDMDNNGHRPLDLLVVQHSPWLLDILGKWGGGQFPFNLNWSSV